MPQQKDWQNDYTPVLPPEIPRQAYPAIKAAVLGMRTTPGTTVGDVARAFLPYVSAERAIDLACSELTRAAAAATNAQQRSLCAQGMNMVRFWSTNNDAHVCEVCQSFHQQPESVWGKQFPAGPPAHEGCRCDITLQLDRTVPPKPKSVPEQFLELVKRVLKR